MSWKFNPFTGNLDFDATDHAAVTIGTANGLSLVGQALSLGLASAGVTGALSGTDWSTFNSKQAALGYTPVNAASAEWVDLTDGGATTLHSHAGGSGDVIDSGVVVGQLTKGVTDSKHITAAAIIPPATNILTITNAAASTLALAITSAKTLTLTAADNYNLTIPATGTAALLATANVFTTQQMVDGTSDQVQIRVQGHSTQTTHLQDWEKSNSTVVTYISGIGGFNNAVNPFDHANNSITNDFSTNLTLSANSANAHSGFKHTLTTGTNGVNYTGALQSAHWLAEHPKNGTVSKLVAAKNQVQNTAGGTIGDAQALWQLVRNSSSGNITTGYGIVSEIKNEGAGTISTAYAFYVTSPAVTAGAITNYYGLYISDVTAAATLNNAIYTNAGNVSLLGSGTRASAAGAVWKGIELRAATATITGSTNITTATGFNYFDIARPTLSAASALTVTNAATLYIANSPLGGGVGPATITNPYSVWIDAGISRFDGDGTYVFELPADATGNLTVATGRIPVKIGGATKYLRYYDD